MASYKERRKEKLAARQGVVNIESSDAPKDSLFIRALGSNDYITREKGLDALTTFLTVKKNVTLEELLKLWKGLFFCFWHSDKEAVQDQLADRLAQLQLLMPQPAARLYYEAFFVTMRREWYGIDALRLDKFLRFVRKFVRCSLEAIQSKGWPRDLLLSYQHFLASGVLLKRDDAQPCLGLYYHICDVYMAELLMLLREKRESLQGNLAEPILGPFVQVLRSGVEKAYFTRVKEGVFDPLIEECLGAGGEGEGAEGKKHRPFKGFDLQALHDALFSLAAKEETGQKGRDALYALCKELMIALRKAAKRAGGHVEAVPYGEGRVSEKKLREEEEEQEGPGQEPQQAPPQKKKARKEKGTFVTPQKEEKAEKESDREEVAPLSSGKKTPKAAAAPSPLPLSSTPTDVKKSNLKKRARSGEEEEGDQEAAPQPSSAARGQGKPSTTGLTAPAKPPAKPAVAPKSASKAARPASGGAGEGASTPLGLEEAGYDSDQTGTKKRVRFALKRNITWDAKKALPPAEVRTPPSARPRGPAIKRSSLLEPIPINTRGSIGRTKAQDHATHAPSPLGRKPATSTVTPARVGMAGQGHKSPLGTAGGTPSGSAGKQRPPPSQRPGFMKTVSSFQLSAGTKEEGEGGKANGASGSAKKGTPKSASRPKAADFFGDLPDGAGY